jgi:hypothetical protein
MLLGPPAMGGVPAGGQAAAGSGGLRLERIGRFQSTIYIDNAPGLGRLLFVVEREGTIAVLRGQHELGHQSWTSVGASPSPARAGCSTG